ncbi:MAG TPA: MBL fold metallo-hydrolase [Thermomicrobiales bacterium]|nr:MBL fold metallo-hydrolase [Thermomicrobiales bacterium]
MSRPARPEKIAPGVYRVDAAPIPHLVSVVLVAGRDGWTLIDTGIPGSAPRIRDALAALGAGPAALRRVFLTHHHADHVGGLPGLRAWATGIEILASEHEAAIVSGAAPPDPASNALLRRTARWQTLPTAPVDRVVRPGDAVAGFRAVATPGHSLGHLSLFHEGHRLLLTGDAFGQLPDRPRVGVRKAFCTDPALARRSAAAALDLDITTAVLSHGPVLRGDARARLAEVVARCDY